MDLWLTRIQDKVETWNLTHFRPVAQWTQREWKLLGLTAEDAYTEEDLCKFFDKLLHGTARDSSSTPPSLLLELWQVNNRVDLVLVQDQIRVLRCHLRKRQVWKITKPNLFPSNEGNKTCWILSTEDQMVLELICFYLVNKIDAIGTRSCYYLF